MGRCCLFLCSGDHFPQNRTSSEPDSYKCGAGSVWRDGYGMASSSSRFGSMAGAGLVGKWSGMHCCYGVYRCTGNLEGYPRSRVVSSSRVNYTMRSGSMPEGKAARKL